MEAELRKAPASYRMSMLSRVRNYKCDVEKLTADVVCANLCCLHCIDLFDRLLLTSHFVTFNIMLMLSVLFCLKVSCFFRDVRWQHGV